jgi:transposase-like protein
MWSLFAPLGKPSRFSSSLYNYLKCATIRQSSLSAVPWTAEEERKLRSLVQQGFGPTRIASEMSDRAFSTIEFRLEALKAGGKPPRADGETRRRRMFTAEEKALMLEKQRQGLSHQGIARYFPDRTLHSVRRCVSCLAHWPVSRRRARDFTEEDLQRIIEMRSKEGKTYSEIGQEMQCSWRTIENLWRNRCLSMVTKETLQSIRWLDFWTAREEEHLVELHRRGTISVSDAARQFPSRTESGYVNEGNNPVLRSMFRLLTCLPAAGRAVWTLKLDREPM